MWPRRISDGRLLKTLKGHNPTAEEVAFRSDGSILATCDHSKILLWRVSDYELLRTITPTDGKTEFLNGFAFSRNGQLLAAVTSA